MNELSLFSGYGGFSLGLRLSGLKVRTVGYVEWERYCQEIIDGYLDDAPIFADIRSFGGTQYRGLVDIITAGFPCQPHSTAATGPGKRQGAVDERNLWPDTLRVISEVEPSFVLLENVPGILSNGYGGVVLGELSSLGYDSQWRVVSAAECGAPHKRTRWWVLAHPRGEPRLHRGLFSTNSPTVGQWDTYSSIWCQDREFPKVGTPQFGSIRGVGNWGKEQPELPRMVDGHTDGVDERNGALGNGIVPSVVREFLRRVA